jgi:hypothetical protein
MLLRRKAKAVFSVALIWTPLLPKSIAPLRSRGCLFLHLTGRFGSGEASVTARVWDFRRLPDAHCHEKVAFLVRTEVRCTLDAAVSVQSRRSKPFLPNGSKMWSIVCVG